MGSLSKLINDIDGANEDQRAEKERLEILLTLAKSKIEKFRTELDAGFANPGLLNKTQIPGTRAIRYIEQYHVASKTEFDQQVNDHLEHAIDAFFSIGEGNNKQSVQEGLKQVIQTGLSGFIGSTSVGESQARMYFVVPENNAFVRIDVLSWKYHFDQKKILDQHDTAVAYVLCKSVIDHTQVTLDELIYLVTQALSSGEFLNDDVEIDKLKPPAKADDLATWIAALKLGTDVKDFLNTTGVVTFDGGKATIKKTAFQEPVPTATNVESMPWSSFVARVLSNDVPYIKKIKRTTKKQDGTAGPEVEDQILNFNSPIDIATIPRRTSPASLAVVEGYIDEMVRVWKKLQSDR